MSDKDLSTKPHYHKGQPGFWWYEEPSGLFVFCEHILQDGGMHVRMVKIPWVSVRAALRRKDRVSEVLRGEEE